jgi:hypothetical protein
MGFNDLLAQSRAGLRFAPNLSFNRISSQSDTLSITPAGSGGRFTFGPILDFPLGSTDNYFTTGLLYAPQRVGVELVNPESSFSRKEIYNLQFVQVPGTFTFLTDEIALDKRIYIEVGAIFEVKIHEAGKDPEPLLIDRFNTFNLVTVIASGVEFSIGTSTTLSLGLGYYRGLGNVVGRQLPTDGNFSVKNDQLSIDFAVRF